MRADRKKIIQGIKVALAGIFVSVFIGAIFLVKKPVSTQTGFSNKINKSNTQAILPAIQDTDNLGPKSSTESMIKDYLTTITKNPKDIETYVEKSEKAYLEGDKSKALQVVEEGLKNNPESDILKNKRDILQKEWFTSDDQETPKQ